MLGGIGGASIVLFSWVQSPAPSNTYYIENAETPKKHF
jgi:hypothetical protein